MSESKHWTDAVGEEIERNPISGGRQHMGPTSPEPSEPDTRLSNVLIESDGTALGTKIFVGGVPLALAQRVELDIGVQGTTAVITIINPKLVIKLPEADKIELTQKQILEMIDKQSGGAE